MKVKVKYVLETEYEFTDDEYFQDESRVCNWIKEDFYKIENRADNVLPPYKSMLFFDFKE